ncbi:MAG: T9SS type A sorting domain-containing protein [Cytophagales bacterium]
MKKIIIVLSIVTLQIAFTQNISNIEVSPLEFNKNILITFNIEATDTISIKIYNMYGVAIKTIYKQTVLQKNNYEIMITTEDLVMGKYIIEINDSKTVVYKKLIIKSEQITNLNSDKVSTNEFVLFPNPLEKNKTVTVNIQGTKTIIISNMSGAIVKKIVTEDMSIDLSELNVGQYLVNVISDNQIKLDQKLIIK